MFTRNWLKLGDILNRPIPIKINIDDKEDTYGFLEDVRLGCSICEKGVAMSYDLNIDELLQQPNPLLNDIKICETDNLSEIDLDIYYLCFDKEYLKILKNIFNIFASEEESELTVERGKVSYSYYQADNDGTKSRWIKLGGGANSAQISSCWSNPECCSSDETVEVEKAHICGHCLQWIKIGKPELDLNKFHIVHPLILVWNDLMQDLITDDFINYHDFNIIINDEDKESLKQTYDKDFKILIESQ